MSNTSTSNKIVPIPEPNSNSTISSQGKVTKIILEGLGWVGSILVLCPYVVTFERNTDFILNTIGATGLLIVCIKSKQYQSIVINTAWIIGGIYKYYVNN
jgi:hypothetical protein